MMTSRAFASTIVEGGRSTTVRVTRDDAGELFLGSPDATSVVEQLLVYDLGDDLGASERLIGELRRIGTGRDEPLARGWNVTRVSIGPVTSTLQLAFEGGGEPVDVATRALHDIVVAFRDFLATTGS